MTRSGVAVLVFAAGLAVAPGALAGPDPALEGSDKVSRPSRPGGGSGGAPDVLPFSDNFDSYPVGPGFPCATAGCVGPGGWELWYTGGITATIASGGAHSGPNYMLLNPDTDVVQTGNLQSGQHVITAMTYCPTGATGGAYFIVMHAYNGINGADGWSIQVKFDGDLGTVQNDYFPGQTQPIIRDQWVELRAEIDLGTNTQSIFYNNVLVSTGQYTAAPGVPAIACLDLYSGGPTGAMSGFRYDTVSVAPAGGGGCYANCDNSTQAPVLNVADFTCFLNRFAGGEPYANCDQSTQQPVLNVADFTCFLNSFAAGCP
jgi:hypothetical protein